MYCTSCGTKNSEDGNFCKQCGSRLDRPVGNRISELEFERAMPDDDQVTALLERAYRARRDGDRDGAIAFCQEALRLRPGSTSGHSLLGQLHEQGGEREQAIAEYERVLMLNPGSIADRVKLDELRGEVPAVVTEKRAAPHIVLADRSKAAAANPVDYRLPAFAMGSVALMVLGGIFTMQFLQHQKDATRPVGLVAQNPQQVAAAGAPTNSGGGSYPQSGANSAGASNITQTNSDGSLTPFLGSSNPIVITRESPPAQTKLPTIIYQPVQTGQPDRNAQPTPKDDGDRNIGSDRVHMQGLNGTIGDDNTGRSNQTASSQPGDNGTSNPRNSVIVRSQSSNSGVPSPANSGDIASTPGSDSRKNMARADLLAMQGNYKLAGTAYIQALDGAGEDTAYIYRRAAWCFEKAGEKATAVGYYQHGIDEAQKLVRAGKQVETARNLIKACETGIKVCSN